MRRCNQSSAPYLLEPYCGEASNSRHDISTEKIAAGDRWIYILRPLTHFCSRLANRWDFRIKAVDNASFDIS